MALRYAPADIRRDIPPSVLLSAADRDADEIVSLANRFGVPVIEAPAAARRLRSVPVDAPIPPELFDAVAVIIHELGGEKSTRLPQGVS